MRAFAEILHVEAVRSRVFLSPDFATTDTTGDIGNGTPGAAIAGLVRGFLFAKAPGTQGGEDVAQQGPEGGEVSDIHRHGSFTEVPVQIGVGDEGGDEAVDFGDDGGDDDEDAHAENDEEDGFLLQRDAHAEEEGEADEEDEDVGGGVEDAFGDFVVLVVGALGW